MKRALIAGLLLLLCSAAVADVDLGILKSTEYVQFFLKPPLGSDGLPVKPTEAIVRAKLSTDSTTVYWANSSTWPFSTIGVNPSIYNGADTSYFLRDLVSNVDGSGCANCILQIEVTLKGGGDTRKTAAKAQIISENFNTLISRLDASVGSRLAPVVAGRALAVGSSGHAALDLGNVTGQLTGSAFATGTWATAHFANQFLTSGLIANGALGAAQAPLLANLDATISSRLSPSGTLARVTTVDQLGGTSVGLALLNEMGDGDEVYAVAELHVLGNVQNLIGYTKLDFNGLTARDTAWASMRTMFDAMKAMVDSVTTLTRNIAKINGWISGATKVYYPNDGTAYKSRFEIWLAGQKLATTNFRASNNPNVLDSSEAVVH